MESTTGANRDQGAGESRLGQRPQFQPLWLASGWAVLDPIGEAATTPRCRWNHDTAKFVAEQLTRAPGYAVHFVWVSITDDGAASDLLATVRLGLENERMRVALQAIAEHRCPDGGCAGSSGDSSPRSIAVAALEGSR